MNSPTSKMKMLNDRWQEIQHEIDREKQYRQQSIEEQLQILDTKLNHLKPLHHQKTEVLIEKLSKLKEQIQALSLLKNDHDISLEKRVKNLEDQVNQQIEKQKAERNEKVEAWIKESDDKLIEICNSLEEVTSEKSETVDMITEKMKKKIFDLEQSIDAESRRRQDNTTELTQTVEKELNRLHSQLDHQKRKRQETNKKLLQMVKEIQLKLQAEIQEERQARKQTNEALLGLLEQTCLKVEKAFY